MNARTIIMFSMFTVASTASLASAQLSISSFVIAGGGGTSNGGTFTLSGTIGQHDAGTMAGGTLQLQGGFWTGVGSNTPACRPDFNGDGALDPDDLADYIGAFFAVPPGAGSDFNADGATDPDDLADYIGAYFAGCP